MRENVLGPDAVRAAATRWARSVFAAPRRFGELVTTIEVQDEVLERVATEVVRRDIREERLACANHPTSPARMSAGAVDPFATTVQALRAASEYVTSCAACQGTGSATCPACQGSQRARCSECNGSGKVPGKRKNWIQCKGCRASGSVPCGHCGASGTIACSGCGASGRQLVWLTYDQRSKWMLSMAPQSPVIKAHRQLGEARVLSESELKAFSVQACEESNGPAGGDFSQVAIVATAERSLDPRLERIARQQYLRLAVVRRDARFEMSGATGTLVLSGNELAGARTPEALRPIRRRLLWWCVLGLVVFVSSRSLLSSAQGKSAYFGASNGQMTLLTLIGFVLAIPAIGGLLRALRPRFALGRVRTSEKILGASAIAMFALVPVVGHSVQPSTAEVSGAMTRGDLARAKTVLEALKERMTAGVDEASDAVAFAEANTLSGEAKLSLLDGVASRHGAKSAEAASIARKTRLAAVQQLVEGKSPVLALAALDRWFKPGGADAEVAEARGKAQDAALSLCSDDPCRVKAATAAEAAAPTPERGARVNAARQQLFLTLATPKIAGEDPLARVKRLRALAVTSARTLEVVSGDADLINSATRAGEVAQRGLASTSLLGSRLNVIEELFGANAASSGRATCLVVDGLDVCFSLDAQSRCLGVYVVGDAKGARRIQSVVWPAERIVSQAVGHAVAAVARPASPGAISRTFEGGTPVVRRWKGDELWELRIGDASP